MSWVGTYILDRDGKPVRANTLEWGVWLETHREQRIVRQDTIDGIKVSTVFLGLDYYYGPRSQPHDPILWETMIFGGEHDQYCQRYTSAEDAMAGHMEALKLVEGWNKEISELEKIFNTPDWTKL